MDESVVRVFEEQKVGTLKLSGLIRTAGYSDSLDYKHCVLGCAYTALTGRLLGTDARRSWGGSPKDVWTNPYTRFAATAFGVPFDVASKAELMCVRHSSPAEIADYVESLGY